MGRNVLARVDAKELEELVRRLLVVLPAKTRPQRAVQGVPIGRHVRGAAAAVDHVAFTKKVLSRFRSLGLPLQDSFDLLHQFVVAIERLGRAFPNLPIDPKVFTDPGIKPQDARKLLLWLRDTEYLTDLAALIRTVPKKSDGIDLLVWILYRQFGALDAERIPFDVLLRHVPGFSPPFSLDAIVAFRRKCASAFRRESDPGSGRTFEELVTKQMPHFSMRKLLNETNSKELKIKGADTGDGDVWQYAGRDYTGGGNPDASNFDIFDAVVRGHNNRTWLVSVADGGFGYLVKKVRIICDPKDPQFDRVVEELRFLAKQNKLEGLASLRTMRQEAARREVASRARLLVHPDCVEPLRAVIAGRADNLLDGFMQLRGLTDRKAALRDLLASIQPALDLS